MIQISLNDLLTPAEPPTAPRPARADAFNALLDAFQAEPTLRETPAAPRETTSRERPSAASRETPGTPHAPRNRNDETDEPAGTTPAASARAGLAVRDETGTSQTIDDTASPSDAAAAPASAPVATGESAATLPAEPRVAAEAIAEVAAVVASMPTQAAAPAATPLVVDPAAAPLVPAAAAAALPAAASPIAAAAAAPAATAQASTVPVAAGLSQPLAPRATPATPAMPAQPQDGEAATPAVPAMPSANAAAPTPQSATPAEAIVAGQRAALSSAVSDQTVAVRVFEPTDDVVPPTALANGGKTAADGLQPAVPQPVHAATARAETAAATLPAGDAAAPALQPALAAAAAELAPKPAAKAAGDAPSQLAQPIGAASPAGAAPTAAASAAPAPAAKPAPLPPQPAAEQVAVQIAKAAADGLDKINVKLKPASLGQIEVQMELASDGRVQVVVSAERPETLDLLQRDARSLERALNDAGLRADSQSLSFNLRDQGQPQGQARDGFGAAPGWRSAADDAAEIDTQLGGYLNARAAVGGVDIRV